VSSYERKRGKKRERERERAQMPGLGLQPVDFGGTQSIVRNFVIVEKFYEVLKLLLLKSSDSLLRPTN
jgi:hypothetical protein